MTDTSDDLKLSRVDLLACALAIPSFPEPPDYEEEAEVDDVERDEAALRKGMWDKYYVERTRYFRRVGALFYAASGGSSDGSDAFNRWNFKAGTYEGEDDPGWWQRHSKSPPTGLTAQSLVDFAKQTAKIECDWFELPSEMDGVARGDPLDVVDVETLEGKEPSKRDFIIDQMIPTGTVTLLAGKAGIGKSILALQAAECLRRGVPFLGLTTRPCTSLIYSCEDDVDELHRRHARLRKGLGPASECLGKLMLVSRVGADNALAVHDGRNGKMMPTASFRALRQTALATGAKLIVIDTVAQTFAGSENDRGQVTAFVNMLTALAQEIDGAILLLSHPPKNEGEYSGSTGWDATVRARLVLYEIKKGSQTRRFLKLAKANYARQFEMEICADSCGLWHLAGARRVGPAGEDELRTLKKGKAVFLAALDELTEQGRPLSDSLKATNYAPKMIVQAGLHQDREVEDLGKAMEALFAAGEIRANGVFGKRPNRAVIKGIVRIIPEPEARIGEPGLSTVDVDEFVDGAI